MDFYVWFARSPLAAALRVFIAVVLSMAVADFVAQGAINFGSWQTWVIAALASAVPVVLRWINPADLEFGVGAHEPSDRFDVWED